MIREDNIDYDAEQDALPSHHHLSPPSNQLAPWSKTFFIKIGVTIVIGFVLLISVLALVRMLFNSSLSKATDVSIWVDRYPEFNYDMPCINHSPGYTVIGQSPDNFAKLYKYVQVSVPNHHPYRMFVGDESKMDKIAPNLKETGNSATFSERRQVPGSLDGKGVLSANRIAGQINWQMLPAFQVQYEYNFDAEYYQKGEVRFQDKACIDIKCTEKTDTAAKCTATCRYVPEGEAGTMKLEFEATKKQEISDTLITMSYSYTAKMVELTLVEDKNFKLCKIVREEESVNVYKCPTEPGHTIRILPPCKGSYLGMPEPSATQPVPIALPSVDSSGKASLRRRLALPYNFFGLFVALIDFLICGAIVYFVYKGEMKSRARRQYETLTVE